MSRLLHLIRRVPLQTKEVGKFRKTLRKALKLNTVLYKMQILEKSFESGECR